MSIGTPPLNSNIPVVKGMAIWPKPWGNWLMALFKSVFGWTVSFYGTVTFDFGSINAQSTATTTLSIPGTKKGDIVIVTPEAPTTGIIVDGHITANVGTVTLRAQNFTSGSINPTSADYNVIVFQQ